MTSARPVQFDFGGTFARPPRATLVLMIVTAVASIVAMVDLGRFGSGTGAIAKQLLLIPGAVLTDFKIWTTVSYLFVLPDPFYLLLHIVLGLWMFAAPLERSWGARRFLLYFFATGTGSAFLVVGLAAIIPALRPPVIMGAWIASGAIALAWVLMNWYSTVYLLIFPVRAPYLLVMVIGVPALYALTGAWEAFLALMLALGIGYAMLNKRLLSPRRAWLHARAWWLDRQSRTKARHLRVVPPPDKDPPKYLN